MESDNPLTVRSRVQYHSPLLSIFHLATVGGLEVQVKQLGATENTQGYR